MARRRVPFFSPQIRVKWPREGSSEVQSPRAHPPRPIYMYDELLIAYFVRALVEWVEALDGFQSRAGIALSPRGKVTAQAFN
jgi:hypothetical protein